MVQTQLAPYGIQNEAILEAFTTVPREKFLPPVYEKTGYCDTCIPFSRARGMLDCTSLASLLQAAALTPEMTALVIGANTGYAAVILSHLVSTVFALEEDKVFLEKLNKNVADHSSGNVIPMEGPLKLGLPEHAPYDFIFIEGGIKATGKTLENIYPQIAPNGSLGIVKLLGQQNGKLTLIKPHKKNSTSTDLQQVTLPPLQPFQEKKCFKF